MSDIITSIITAGVNNHATVSEEANAVQTDLLSAGVIGAITNTGGVSPATGSFAINQSSTPAMTIDITLGAAYITCVPSGQSSQLLRARMTANTTAFVINANATGSTRYDWVYLKADAAKAAAPSASANDVVSIYVSRSTSNTSDNGTPPTYGDVLAVITVANGATSIVNANITDKRATSGISNTALAGGINSSKLSNPYKFSVGLTNAQNSVNGNTKILLNSEEFDTGNNFDSITDHRFIAPVAGFYQFNFSVNCATTPGSIWQSALFKNGAVFKFGSMSSPVGYETSVGSSVVKMEVGDYIELYIAATGVFAINNSATGTYLNGFIISAT